MFWVVYLSSFDYISMFFWLSRSFLKIIILKSFSGNLQVSVSLVSVTRKLSCSLVIMFLAFLDFWWFCIDVCTSESTVGCFSLFASFSGERLSWKDARWVGCSIWVLWKHTGSPHRSVGLLYVSHSVVVVCGQGFRGLWVAWQIGLLQFSEASAAGSSYSLFCFHVGGSSSLGILLTSSMLFCNWARVLESNG